MASNSEMVEKFTEVYIDELTKAVLKHPFEYMFPAENVPEVVARMMVAIQDGHYFLGPALKATAIKLNIKPTLKGIKEALNDHD